MRLYFDEDSSNTATIGALKARGHDVESASSLKQLGRSDEAQLTFAHVESRVLVTANQKDFARLHGDWLRSGKQHSGIIVVTQGLDLGELLRRFEFLRSTVGDDGMSDRLEYLNSAQR